MSILEKAVLAWCALFTCEVDRQEIQLPESDQALFEYEQPTPEPEPIPEPEPEPSFAPLVVEKTVYVEAPAQPVIVEKIAAEPKPDARLAAYQALLAYRRSAHLGEGKLSQGKFDIQSSVRDDQQPFSLPALEGDFLPASLDFKFNEDEESDTRYQAEGVDSGLPIDNTRILRQDRYISGVFEAGVNSQLATGGEVIIQVTENVFGAHGRSVLIPKGSRMVCNYEVPATANSTRLEFECGRILLADSGAEIYQISSRLYDVHGNLGVSGHVDRRFWDRYGEALIVTGISVAARIAAGTIKTQDNQNLATSINAGTEELSQRFGEITANILGEQINTKPIIRIAQGTTVTIKPSADWYISEYE